MKRLKRRREKEAEVGSKTASLIRTLTFQLRVTWGPWRQNNKACGASSAALMFVRNADGSQRTCMYSRLRSIYCINHSCHFGP